MSGPEILTSGPSDREAIEALDRSVRDATGHPALGDAVWRDLDDPAPESVGYLAATATRRRVPARRAATPSRRNTGRWVSPANPQRREGDRRCSLAAAQNHIAASGGGQAILWQFDPTPGDDDLLLGGAGSNQA